MRRRSLGSVKLRFSLKRRMGLLLLNPANFRQSSNTKEGVKRFQTIAEVADNVPYYFIINYRDGKIEN